MPSKMEQLRMVLSASCTSKRCAACSLFLELAAVCAAGSASVFLTFAAEPAGGLLGRRLFGAIVSTWTGSSLQTGWIGQCESQKLEPKMDTDGQKKLYGMWRGMWQQLLTHALPFGRWIDMYTLDTM